MPSYRPEHGSDECNRVSRCCSAVGSRWASQQQQCLCYPGSAGALQPHEDGYCHAPEGSRTHCASTVAQCSPQHCSHMCSVGLRALVGPSWSLFLRVWPKWCAGGPFCRAPAVLLQLLLVQRSWQWSYNAGSLCSYCSLHLWSHGCTTWAHSEACRHHLTLSLVMEAQEKSKTSSESVRTRWGNRDNLISRTTSLQGSCG